MKRERQDRGRAGFTLIEIMVVVIILGVIAATIIPRFVGMTHEAKVTRAQVDLSTLASALERFYLNLDRYPTTEEGLQILVVPPAEGAKDWKGPYIAELRRDPWGSAYGYRSPGIQGNRPYDLWSRGSDRADGGQAETADISNWEEPAEKK